MSVLIKGMKMPTEGRVMTIYKLKGEFYASLNGTELCPLIELPDHGDLIDRDALVIKGGRANGKMFLAELLKNMPVVIPAEMGEE